MRLTLTRASLFGLAVVVLVFAAAGQASANGPTAVPEIDGGSLTAGFAAASSAVLILRSRLRRR